MIKENEHEHVDLIYLATPTSEVKTVLNKEETDDIAWFSLEEILKEGFDTFQKNKKWCKFFSELISKATV